MPRMKHATRLEQQPSSSSSDHTLSPSSQPSRFPSHLADPEYVQLASRVASQTLLKEKSFPLTPATNPFVGQLFQLELTGLAQPRTTGNLSFVRQYYTHARQSHTYGINFRGVSIPTAFTSVIIREHYHLPVVPRCPYTEMIAAYPWDDVIRTLCPEGTQWLQPRGAQRYIRRSDLLPQARPWLHFICNNILPTLHLTNIPKEQALYIYLLMTGHPVDLASAISSALRQCVLSTNPKHKLLFPHLISDLFRAFRVPEHPADLTFSPASPFVYVRLGQPRAIPPPPPAHPASSSSTSSPLSPPAPSSAPPVLPPVSSPHPIPTPVSSPAPSTTPAPSEVALLREGVIRLEARFTTLEAQVTATHSLLTMIAAHLGLPVPPPAPVSSAAPCSSVAAPPDPLADDPAS